MQGCLFCGIVAGHVEASIVYRDDHVTAFLDIQPVNPGHLLIVPNRHATYLADLDPDDGAQLFRVGQRLVAALRRSELRCEGVNLFLADGEAAMQEVFHVHLHVFPRYKDDGFSLTFGPQYWTRPERSELARVAEQLRNVLSTT
jgi:histidine triad (HIT) family protein